MPKNYPSVPTQTQPYELPAEFYEYSGRIVRAVAEFEDILTLFIATVCETSESKAKVMLGRTGLSNRVNIAKMLASMREDNAKGALDSIVDHQFHDIVFLRNALAHGTFMGADKNGNLFFSTMDLLAPENDAARGIVAAWTLETIKNFASAMDEWVSRAETNLQVQELRQVRYSHTLQAHPKGQKQQQKKTKRP